MDVAIGVDLESVRRFENLNRESDADFLHKVFTENELEYSFSRENTGQHLAGRFVAKEAAFKALDQIPNIVSTNVTCIEVLRPDPHAPPELRIEGEALNKIQSSLSLAHTNELATATVFILKA